MLNNVKSLFKFMQERFFKRLFEIYNKLVVKKRLFNIFFYILTVIFIIGWILIIGINNINIIQNNGNISLSGEITAIENITKVDEGMQKQNLIIKTPNEMIVATNNIDGGSKIKYEVGDRVILKKEDNLYTVSGFERINSLIYLILILITFILIVAGISGAGALLSLSFSIIVIFMYIIPEILNGANPYILILTTSMFLSVFNIFISNGIRSKSFLGAISILITLIICAICTPIVTSFSNLVGSTTANEILLEPYKGNNLDLLGIFQGTILIGVLGVLDDVVTEQIVTIEELSNVNEELNFNELFIHGMNVGKEQIISMVNTLALAFMSIALPLILSIIIASNQSWIQIINSDAISEELIRMFISSMSLISAIPICSALASAYYFYHNKYKSLTI